MIVKPFLEYGHPPIRVGRWEPEWHEYMHYLYLPVKMAGQREIRLPERLRFAEGLVKHAVDFEQWHGYVYVTARRGFATPGNPLNRPGWHADGFGTRDVNYIWTDRYPTRFATGPFIDISDDHVRSAEQFEEQIADVNRPERDQIEVEEGEEGVVYRLDPSVIHAVPIIPEPGGHRSFLKISLSNDRYNLLGNSHNYLFSYGWEMWSREEVRNHPAYAGGDAGPQS